MNGHRTALVDPYMSPERSPENRDGLLTHLRHDDWFTAVLLPIGAMTGIIVLFALWTTDRLIIPGISNRAPQGDITLFGLVVGSTDLAPLALWVAVLLAVFVLIGAGLGMLAGKAIGRLSRWGT